MCGVHSGGVDPLVVYCHLESGVDCSIKLNNGMNALELAKKFCFSRTILVICDWYRKKYEDVLYFDDTAEIPTNLLPFDSLLEDVLEEVVSRGRVLKLLMLLNHKSSYDGFVHCLENDLYEELIESLVEDMMQVEDKNKVENVEAV